MTIKIELTNGNTLSYLDVTSLIADHTVPAYSITVDDIAESVPFENVVKLEIS